MTSMSFVSKESAPPGEELARRDELSEHLVALIRLRWIALLGVLASVVTASAYKVVAALWPLLAVTAVLTLLNFGFLGLHRTGGQRTLRALGAESLLQIMADVIGLGLLLFFAGGLSNPFVFCFTLYAVMASSLLEPRHAYGVALLSTAVVVGLGLAEQVPALKPASLPGSLGMRVDSGLERIGLAFVLSTAQILSVYFVTSIVQPLRRRNLELKRLNSVWAERVDILAASERKLKTEHDRARAILECMDEGVVVVDLTGKVLWANPAGLKNVVVALEDTYRRAGVLLGHEDHGELNSEIQHLKHQPQNSPDGTTVTQAPQCLTSALESGGNLSPEALQLIGADPPRTERQARLKALDTPVYVHVERLGRHFENTLCAVRTPPGETLGLVVVSREITERRHAKSSLGTGVALERNTTQGTS